MDIEFIKKKDDFLAFELQDDVLIPHAIDQLRSLYPNLLQITYSHIVHQQKQLSSHSIQKLEDMDTKTLFSQFYHEMKNLDLTNEQIEIVNHLLEQVGEEYETH